MAPRIIVVDDNLPTLALMHDLLAPVGFLVDCASTIEAGLGAARQERTDLIIIDLFVDTPESGWRLLERLRADPATADVPVIACSADHRALLSRPAWLRERNCTILAKPFEFDELLERVAAAVPATPPPTRASRYWSYFPQRDNHLVSSADAPLAVGHYDS